MIRQLLGAIWPPYAQRDKVDEIREAQEQVYTPKQISPYDVEERIDQAGRALVFARAKALGWGGSLPPLWVWNQIACEIIAENTKAEALEERKTARLQ